MTAFSASFSFFEIQVSEVDVLHIFVIRGLWILLLVYLLLGFATAFTISWSSVGELTEN